MSFADDLERIAAAQGDRVGEWAKAVKVEMFSDVVDLTRIDTGRLKGNWQIQEDTPAEGELERLDPEGKEVKAEIEQNATQVGLTYLANNLPYAEVWEERDAMVGQAVARLQKNARDMALELNK